MMQTPDLAAARARIAAAQRFLLITHIHPDGDAIGSLLGLGLALRAAGKEVVMACADPAPDVYAFLPNFADITMKASGDFDAVAVLDAADLGRTGRFAARLTERPADFLFDHHITNPGFAHFNFIDVQAASTAELVAELLEPLGLPLTRPAAEALLTGLVTDTLGFKTSNTTPRTLAIAQRLMETGASLTEIYDASLNKRSFAATRLWGEGLRNAQLADHMVWAVLPLTARVSVGYSGKDDADLVNVLTTVREAKVALMFVERDNGTVKVSWRSMSPLNVAAIAQSYGGGGHAPAAGAEIRGPLAEVQADVLAATRAALRQLNGSKPE